jgi:hypothetical protein
LVVQPANGGGLLLVGEDGTNPQQICSAGTRCAGAFDPVWSPDGSEIAVSSRRRSVFGRVSFTSVIYPDGSCLACSVPGAFDNYGFLPDGRVLVSTDPGLAAMTTDGVGVRRLDVSGSWQQLAWSASGQLAAVRLVNGKSEVFVIDSHTGKMRQLTRGGASSPSWSPDGRRLAVVEGGWIALVSSRGGRLRRLARGGAPAWAPDGKEVAFVGAYHRLFVIAVRGGTPRAVGHIRAVRVDWQPVTGTPQSRCQAPAGARVLAAAPNAIITVDVSQDASTCSTAGSCELLSVLGCLASDGHERLLESLSAAYDGGTPGIGPVAVAGDYVALVNERRDLHYAGPQNVLAAFDIRTGTSISSGHVRADCDSGGPVGFFSCNSGIDQVVVSGIDGANAAHTIVLNSDGANCALTEQIVAIDSTGMHILDSITTKTPCNPPPVIQLRQLSLSGHTLTWSHAGTPETAQLN